jgi:MOSC domain-containing protein YiiM
MFGSPSGPVSGAIGEIERGWVVARLDLALDAYGDDPGSGTVEALLLAPAAEAPPARVERAVAVAGRGLEGDRYHASVGTFRPGNALTLVEAEALEALPLGFEEARRNVVTRGVDLNALVGRRFRIGEVECSAVRLAEPCAHLERLTRDGVLRGLVHRAGIRADLLTGGTIAVGDPVEPL